MWNGSDEGGGIGTDIEMVFTIFPGVDNTKRKLKYIFFESWRHCFGV